MTKKRLGLSLILLLVLPSAMGDLLINVYNAYVPIFIQGGNSSFVKNQLLTNGFGFGAIMVGFWLVADNILAILIQPFIGAWSDRLNSRFGRRIPFILYTLPLIIIGYSLIPLIPTLIPQQLNGKFSELTGLFILFALACSLFYIGYLPARVIMQTMRQEIVWIDQRPKVEAWFNLFANIMTVLAFTIGAQIYKSYGPLLFWIILVLYVISCIVLAIMFKDTNIIAEGIQHEKGGWKLIVSVLKFETNEEKQSFFLFLASIFFISLAFGGSASFSSSWAVTILKMNEAAATSTLSISSIATILAVLPAGYLAGGKLGRRSVYINGVVALLIGATLISVFPSLYILCFALLGLGMGAFVSTMLPLLFDLSPVVNFSGTLVGIFNISLLSGFIFGSLIVGAIIQNFGYMALYPSILCMGSLGLICIFFTQRKPNVLTEVNGLTSE